MRALVVAATLSTCLLAGCGNAASTTKAGDTETTSDSDRALTLATDACNKALPGGTLKVMERQRQSAATDAAAAAAIVKIYAAMAEFTGSGLI